MVNRKSSELDGLKPEMRGTVEQMLLSGCTYDDIVDYLRKNDIVIGLDEICRYARSCNASAAMLHMTQQNFQRLTDKMDECPDLDTTEAIVRLACQHVLGALANTDEKDWAKLDKNKLLSAAAGLIRAAAYKKRADHAIRSSAEKELDGLRSTVFEAMGRERPELYREVAAFLREKQHSGEAELETAPDSKR